MERDIFSNEDFLYKCTLEWNNFYSVIRTWGFYKLLKNNKRRDNRDNIEGMVLALLKVYASSSPTIPYGSPHPPRFLSAEPRVSLSTVKQRNDRLRIISPVHL